MVPIPPYPISMKHFISRPHRLNTHKLDERGVILYKIPYTEKFDYYPVTIAQYALGHYEKYLEKKDEESKKYFFVNVNWLLENLKITDGLGVWEHRYTLPYGYNFKVPWVHGMAQGLGASVMLRAYSLTHDGRYLDAVEPIIRSFEVEIPDGGVRFMENGDVWFEEYGVLPPVHILNGFMFILIGLYEAHKYAGLDRAKSLFLEGVKTLKKNIKRYDIGYWSLYDLLHRYPAPKNYHNLHIRQLKVMKQITGEYIFLNYSERWANYEKSKLNVLRAMFKRSVVHVKKLGLVGSMKRYLEVRKYKSSK